MPMPKPKRPEDLSVNGKTPKKLIKVVKPSKKDNPNILNEMVDLAKKQKLKKEKGE